MFPDSFHKYSQTRVRKCSMGFMLAYLLNRRTTKMVDKSFDLPVAENSSLGEAVECTPLKRSALVGPFERGCPEIETPGHHASLLILREHSVFQP